MNHTAFTEYKPPSIAKILYELRLRDEDGAPASSAARPKHHINPACINLILTRCEGAKNHLEISPTLTEG
jgi:hypothetical protein